MKLNIVLLTFLMAFGITSCAMATEFNVRKVDEPFKDYVRDYLQLAKYHCPKLRVSNFYSVKMVKSLENRTWVGLCTTKMNGFSIEIAEDFWLSSNPNEQRQLMYHEMAHCVIKREHEEKDPHHYMYPTILYVSYEDYIRQTIEDIEAYCKTL